MRLLSEDEMSLTAASLPSEILCNVRNDLLNDPSCGPPLRNYLAITHKLVAQVLTDQDRFYNEYFWFKRFAVLYQASHGFDAGVEQQAFEILERAAIDVDRDQIARLNEQASNIEARRMPPI